MSLLLPRAPSRIAITAAEYERCGQPSPAHSPTSSISENRPPSATAGCSPAASRRRRRREQRKVLQPISSDDSEDGYSSHPSIYEASVVGSEEERNSDTDKAVTPYSLHKPDDTDLFGTSASTPIDQNDGSEDGISVRRNVSSFSGISLMEPISEQKSGSTVHDDSDGYVQVYEDSSDDEYDHLFYYEYASPTQPLHPALARSAPAQPTSSAPNSDMFSPQGNSVPIMNAFFSRGSPMISPNNAPLRPSFRPPVSMYRSYGSLSSHPFHRAPVANTGRPRGSVDIPTPDELESPGSRSRAGSFSESGVWGKVLRGFCLVCCCVIVEHPEPHNGH